MTVNYSWRQCMAAQAATHARALSLRQTWRNNQQLLERCCNSTIDCRAFVLQAAGVTDRYAYVRCCLETIHLLLQCSAISRVARFSRVCRCSINYRPISQPEMPETVTRSSKFWRAFWRTLWKEFNRALCYRRMITNIRFLSQDTICLTLCFSPRDRRDAMLARYKLYGPVFISVRLSVSAYHISARCDSDISVLHRNGWTNWF